MKRTLLGQLRVGFFSVASHGRPNQKLLGPSRTLTGSTTTSTSTSTNRNLWTFTSAENSLSKIFHGQNGRGCLNGGNLAAGGPHRFFLPRSSPTPSHIFQATRRLTTSDGDDNDLDLFPSTDEPVVCEDLIRREVAADLFHQYARVRQDGVASLDVKDVANLLREIGKEPTEEHLQRMFSVADQDNNGVIDIHEFLEHYDYILDGNPARIILVVGGPGSGKGVLSAKLQKHCGVVHLSSGDLLRTEVARGSALGNQVRDIMARGELVSSAIMVALMKRRMRDHPGKRVLLDGFPRSLENAHDLVALCGKPELALHLVCDDTILLERIVGRASIEKREDDTFQTAIRRLRTFHKYHYQTLDWLREQHVPIVNLDCSGTPESVWEQLKAIGRLMRPAVKLPGEIRSLSETKADTKNAA